MDRKLKFEFRFGDYYVPDNSENDSDYYTYEDFEDLCEEEWMLSDSLQKEFSSSQELLETLIDIIDWEFPGTVIDRFK